MKKIATILSILVIALTLASVSYAGGDGSPGKKATTIKSIEPTLCSHEAIPLLPVMTYATDIVQAQETGNVMIVKRCEALPVTSVKPAAVKRRWRTREINFTSNFYIKELPDLPQKFDSGKFSDRHRRLCNAG